MKNLPLFSLQSQKVELTIIVYINLQTNNYKKSVVLWGCGLLPYLVSFAKESNTVSYLIHSFFVSL